MNDLDLLLERFSQYAPEEAAFALRALAAWGRATQASPLVQARSGQMGVSGGSTPLGTAIWLWAAGEELERLEPDARKSVLDLASRTLPDLLSKPHEETAVYGALFGAARALGPYLPELELARWQKEIREHVFAQATHADRLAGSPGTDELNPALLLLVPFGLFGPEDLLMVATVHALEAAGVPDGPATAWLALYYQVKGTSPKRLAELRATLQDGSVWSAAFRLLLSHGEGEAAVIRHIPTGHDHPYHRYTPERIPRDPRAGQPVELRATVMGSVQGLCLEWRLNGAEQPAIPARHMSAGEDSEAYWTASLEPLLAGSRVEYRWAAERCNTPWYSFGALVENGIGRAVAVRPDGARAIIICTDLLGTQAPMIALQPEEGGCLRLSLRFADGAAAGAPSHSKPPERFQVAGYEVRLCPEPFSLTVVAPDGTPVLEDGDGSAAWGWREDPDGRVAGVQRVIRLHPRERIYGTGERFDRLDRRGTSVVNTIYNEYKQQGDRTYLPVPVLMLSRGCGLWLDTDHVGEIDAGSSDPGLLRLAFQGGALDMVAIPGPGPADVVQRFTVLTGRPELPPRWAFGPWMSSNNWDSQHEVLQQVGFTEKHDIPASVLVVEQWSDEATFYLFNDAQYQARPGGEAFRYGDFTMPAWGRWPDPKALAETLHDRGMKLLLWQIPVLKHMNGLRVEQHERDTAHAIACGYVVTNADGSPYRIPDGWFAGSHLVDFTNPAAVQWWLSKRRYLLDEIGAVGFKTDGGEFVWDREARFADGTRGDLGRNRYANQYIGAAYRYVQERTGGQGVTFSRAGYTGAQAFPLHWAGDEASTWPALRASLIAGLNAGLVGIFYWGWDLGGFSGDIPTAELYCRGAAMACFCPVMQYHAESKAQFNQDRTPWNVAERTGRPEVLDAYRFFAHLRLNLLPYIYSQAVESRRTGLPMMRPLFLMHPDDPACAARDDQYYFGSDLLVAPVLEPGATGRNVYLPAGGWFDFWTGRHLTGPATVWQETPWDRIPVFVREGSAIPVNLAEGGRLGEGMCHADALGLRNPYVLIFPAGGGRLAEWHLDAATRAQIETRLNGTNLSVSIRGMNRTVRVRAWLPGERRPREGVIEPGQAFSP